MHTIVHRRVSVFRNWIVFLVGIYLLVLAPCYAQTVVATLSGSVTDPTGASVPEAAITITNQETGVSTTTTTDSAGSYIFPSLRPGTYKITAEKAGFTAPTLTGITLYVDQKATINITLQLGQVTTHMEVRGEAPLVSNISASVGTVVEEKQVLDLPLNARRVGALAVLVPGTVVDNGGFANSPLGSPFSESTYVASGERDSSNLTLIDGVQSRNLTFGGFALQPPPDATAEFKIQTNIYDAAFGITAGSTMNLVTKSGTNQLHGSAYEFLRNDKLDARNFFTQNTKHPVTGAEIPGTARPEFRRNQFGGSIGGPIRKNKLFVFGLYEGLRQVQGLSLGGIVPTDQQKAGDLSSFLTGTTANLCGAGGPANLNFDTGQLFNPATESLLTCPTGSAKAGKTILVGQSIPGNRLTTIDPVAQKILAGFPEPNRSGSPNFINQHPLVRNDNQFDVRGDNNINDSNQLFVRYLFGQSTSLNPTTASSILPGFDDRIYYRGQNAVVGYTHTFSPNKLFDVRLGFQRNTLISNCSQCPRAQGFMENFSINNLHAVTPDSEGFPLFSFTNFATVGDSNNRPLTSPDMVETYGETMTWIRGRHSIVFGSDIQPWQRFRAETVGFAHGSFSFNGRYSGLAGEIPGVTKISDFADFLQGFPSGATRQVLFQPFYMVGGKFIDLFFQDNIKLTPRLSMNIGMRWEDRVESVDKRNNRVNFVALRPKFSGPGDGILISPSPDAENDAFCTNPAFSFVYSADRRCLVADSALRASLGFTGRTRQTLLFPDHGDFAPRIGFSWQPFSTKKLVVHAGYGIFYDLPIFNQKQFGVIDPLHSSTQTVVTTFGAPPLQTNGVLATTAQIFGSAAGPPPLSSQQIGLWEDPNSKTPRLQEWSLGWEWEFAQNWGLEANYIGNLGKRLGVLHILGNQPEPGVGPVQPRRPYPDFGPFLYSSFNGSSNYHSLQIKVTHRYANGVVLLAS